MPARSRVRPLARTAALVARELRAARDQARLHSPAPPTTGLVLDVGGGDRPHPRADVVVDKFVADDFERAGGRELSLTRPLVVASGERLPFADRAFSYAIASHVLEHSEDPRRFASELARVAEAGFIQVPTRRAELTFGWPFHRWLIDREGDTLVFAARGEARAHFGEAFHQDFARSALLRAWWAASRSAWQHSLHWRGAPRVRLDDAVEGAAERSAEFDVERTRSVLERAAARGALQPLGSETRAILRCPACGGGLGGEADRLDCADCGRRYPLAGPVPLLVEEAATAPERTS